MVTAEHLELFVKGSIVGQFAGDAVGHPYSFIKNPNYPVSMLPDPDGKRGNFSSFSAMNLCTMATINENDELNGEDLMEKLYDLYIGGYLMPDEDSEYVNLGPITSQAIANHANNVPVDKCAPRDQNDCDCLTRMLPIGLYWSSSSIDELVDAAHAACRITHGHIKSQACCAIYCLIIRNLLQQNSEKVFDLLTDYYKTKKMHDYESELQSIKDWKNNNQCKGTTGLEDCFWSAWMAYSKYEFDFELCVNEAIKNAENGCPRGAASIAGGLCALSIGLNAIPTKWLNTLHWTSEAMEIILKFTDAVVKRELN